ncbi:MAG: glutamate--tRNA ligase [Planctomycetota bacterium]
MTDDPAAQTATETPTGQDPIVTRFAPSPTGHLHVGGARTALFCWALAKKLGGRFLLRVEDTDQKRSRDEAARGILDDLAWLGIGWDDGPEHQSPAGAFGGDERSVGPFYQSQRETLYQTFFDRLLERGLAYPAFDTPEELAAMRDAAQKDKRTFRYTQPEGYDLESALERAKTEEHVLRFRMPDEPVVVRDLVLGEITFTSEHFDHFVIRKKDGFPTYHFAVVVDDELMGVTHVLRGQEHLNNTPKHVGLMRALTHEDGTPFRVPAFAHVPLISNADGTKMSKRDKDKAVKKAARDAKREPADLAAACGLPEGHLASWFKDKSAQLELTALEKLGDDLGIELPEIEVDDFRRAGYLPEVVNNFLALLGWNPGDLGEREDGERFGMAFLAERFEPGRIGKSNSKFDREKLLSFNADTIQHRMTDGGFADAWRGWCKQNDPGVLEDFGGRWLLAARAARPRAKTLRDAADPLRFARIDATRIEYDEKAVKKGLLKGEPNGLEVLSRFEAEVLGAGAAESDPLTPDRFEPETIDARIRSFCESHGLGLGKVAAPLRVAITGTQVSPGLGETLALVGLDGVRERVRRCLKTHRTRDDSA